MIAILKREWKSYFQNITGWLFIAAVLALYGLYFLAYNLRAGYPYVSYTLSAISFIMLIAVPILTMRSMAEERHSRTDQLVLTAPVSLGKMIFGKFLAMVGVFTVAVAVIAVTPLVLAAFGTVPMGENYVAVLGFWLYGCTCIAVGMLASALTESQVIAAVLTFVFLFAFYMMNGISSFFSQTSMSTCVTFGLLILAAAIIIYTMIKNILISAVIGVIGEVALIIIYVVKSSIFEGGIQKVLDVFNLSGHFDNFTSNIFDIKGIVYFLSVIAVCLFLTTQSILKRRWN